MCENIRPTSRLSKVIFWQTDTLCAEIIYHGWSEMRSSLDFKSTVTPTHAVFVCDEWWLLKTEMRTECRYYRTAIKSNTSWHLASCRRSARHLRVSPRRRPPTDVKAERDFFRERRSRSALIRLLTRGYKCRTLPTDVFPVHGHFVTTESSPSSRDHFLVSVSVSVSWGNGLGSHTCWSRGLKAIICFLN